MFKHWYCVTNCEKVIPLHRLKQEQNAERFIPTSAAISLQRRWRERSASSRMRDLLHPPHVPLDAHRLTGERVIRRRENGRQQAGIALRRNSSMPVISDSSLRMMQELSGPASTHRSGKGMPQPVPYFGKRLHTPLHQRVVERSHQIADTPVGIRRLGAYSHR